MSSLLRERDMSRIAHADGDSASAAAPQARIRLTGRSVAISPGNVPRTRYRPRNNREILPKPAHGTYALQEYGAAGVEQIGRASCRERGVDLGGRRIIKKKK